MNEIQQGDIFWVDIPAQQTEGSEQYGRRPFVVMSRHAVNKGKTVIVVPLTTFSQKIQDANVLARQPPYCIVVPTSEITKDVSCQSELSLSVAKTDQVRVVDKSRLQTHNRIGRLSQTAILSISVGLAYVFDIR